uniref:Uncharacterized protein n=1 Tax=Bionectria ochroleuca TaxID=29856 RepID=A0A0B7K7I9_BIOOC
MGNDLVPRDAADRHVGGPIAFGDCAVDLLTGFFAPFLEPLCVDQVAAGAIAALMAAIAAVIVWVVHWQT